MTLEQIKKAVDAGKAVHWSSNGYRVIRDNLGHYLIGFDIGGRRENYIGLTWTDGKTMNGKPSEFYVGERR